MLFIFGWSRRYGDINCEWPLQLAVHTVKSFMQIVVGVSTFLLAMNTEWGFWFCQMCSVHCHMMLCGNWTNASVHNKIVERFGWKFDSDLWCDKSVFAKGIYTLYSLWLLQSRSFRSQRSWTYQTIAQAAQKMSAGIAKTLQECVLLYAAMNIISEC